MRKHRELIKLSKIDLNKGQIPWLPTNPRQWTKEDLDRLINSLEEDPDFLDDRPPLVVEHEGRYVTFGGNMRISAEKKRKAKKEVECVVYNPESEEDRQTVIRRSVKDNGSWGEWDADTWANEWAEFAACDWGQPDWLKEGAEEEKSKTEAKDDNFDEEKEFIEVRCKPGDVWELGEHRLMCGDSIDLEEVKKLVGGVKSTSC